MNESLKDKISKDTEKADESEELFMQLMYKEGHSCLTASRIQNMYEHWDVMVLMKDNTVEYVDVKGLKEATADGRTWIELQNVRGDIGWLYAPKLTVIAFEKIDCFVLVRRIDLVPIIEANIKKAEIEDGEVGLYYDKNGLKDYRRYCRKNWGRDDRVVKAPFEDFEHLIFKTILK